MRINAKQIIEWCGASVIVAPLDPSRLATSITWDSRDVCPDSVYVAFPGNRVDGHSFIKDALLAGAIIIMVMDRVDDGVKQIAHEMGAAILEVADTRSAFTDLAYAWRKHINAHVVALTGSTGKTTTKNLIRDVLATTYKTVATKANQNNELGVPNTILAANPETQCVVVEMGMRGRGQITELCNLVEPEIGVITNVGECHIELLGSQENIACAKGEILEALPAGVGHAVVNGSDAWTAFMVRRAELPERHIGITYYGVPEDDANPCSLIPMSENNCRTSEAEQEETTSTQLVWASHVTLDEEGCPAFQLHIDDATLPCKLSLRGVHNVYNALAAAAVGLTLHVSPESIVAGLAASLPEPGRQEIVAGRQGITIINDAYNANPDSMRASLSLFSSMAVQRNRYAVLGDMGELGDYAQACHEGIGKFVATLPIDGLVCVGPLAALIAQAAVEAGFPQTAIFTTENRGEALNYLETHMEPGDSVLVKASHAMELDRIVRGLAL